MDDISQCEGLPPMDAATVDHIKPRQKVGTAKEYRSAKNKVLACWKCNARRAYEDSIPYQKGPLSSKARAVARKFEHRIEDPLRDLTGSLEQYERINNSESHSPD